MLFRESRRVCAPGILGALGLCLTLVTACGSTARPGSIASDGAVDLPPIDDFVLPPLDVGFPTDTPPGMDAGDAAPADGATADGSSPDGGGDAATTDAADGSTPAFCGFPSDVMNQLAVHIATCTGGSPQQYLERFYRPEQWQGGPFAARPCDVLRCAAMAHTCVDVLGTCLKYTATALPDAGVCAGPMPQCNGHFADHCENGRTLGDDCEAIGGRCVATATEVACAPTRGDPCSSAATTRCNGTTAERCIAAVFVPVARCGLTASACDPSTGTCVGTGDACTGDASACDGTTLRRCINGHYQPMDCGALVEGAACQTVGGASFCGVGADCDPGAAPAGGRCEGNTLVLCAGGHALRYDCVANGFTACGGTGCVP